MVDWEMLSRAGVPIGAVRRLASSVDAREVRAAVAAARDEALTEPEQVALHAWLAALAHHWPDRFASLAGDEGRVLLERFKREPFDADRYLKLRRIAIEHLAALVERTAA
jgi:hypothetical protein